MTVIPPELPASAVPPVPPPARRSNAVRHTAVGTRTYPCNGCGGQLEFGIAQQKLHCKHCGSLQELTEAVGLAPPSAHDLRAALAQVPAQRDGEPAQVPQEKEVVCQSCGGHTTFTGTLASSNCPYCATPIQREDVHDAPTRLAVDGILPFAVDEKVARERLEEWISKRWFAPSEFKTYKQTGSFASVYAAYFTYDAETSTSYSGRRGEDYTVTVGSGDNKHTEVRTRWYSVSGHVTNSFDDLAVLANDGLDRDKVTELEPWPTAGAVPFSPEYVAGHLSRTYDRDLQTCFVEAEQRMDAAIESTIRSDIGGDHQEISTKSTSYGAMTYQHLLLPIWLLAVIYDGNPFQVFINGVTGEVQGERPYSKVKIAAAVVLALVLAILALVLWNSV